MSYKARTLFSLIEDINTSLFLPHIQRPFVWEEEQMLRLFDSLMRNYPIQTLLLWRTKDEIKARKFMEEIDWEKGELPSSYFGRLRLYGIDISKHLLLSDVSQDPTKLVFDIPTYRDFRDRRLKEIGRIASTIVNPELIGAKEAQAA